MIFKNQARTGAKLLSQGYPPPPPRTVELRFLRKMRSFNFESNIIRQLGY